MVGTRTDAEDRIRSSCAKGDFGSATNEALRTYGHEVMRFLCAFHKSEATASDVFSVFAEDLWKSMPKFAWECSLRTWAYTLARRASWRVTRRRAAAAAELPRSFTEIAQGVRTETLTFLRTEKRTRLRALRDALPEQDQALLMLRVDRGLSWEELAQVFDGEAAAVSPEDRKRAAARWRQRFQLLKTKLKAQAKRQGLYASSAGEGVDPADRGLP